MNPLTRPDRRLATLTGAAACLVGAVLLSAPGCSGGDCNTWCDATVTCSIEDLQELQCKYRDDEAELESECEQECEEARDNLSDREREEFEACVSCLSEDLGDIDECNDGDFADALDDCENDCEEDGFTEFLEDFKDDFKPETKCAIDDDDGSGGQGATSGTGGAGAAGTGAGSGTGGSDPNCVRCGPFLTDLQQEVPIYEPSALCGFQAYDEVTGALHCNGSSSCELLNDLFYCACTACGDQCATCGAADDSGCLGCLSTFCTNELNTCNLDQ